MNTPGNFLAIDVPSVAKDEDNAPAAGNVFEGANNNSAHKEIIHQPLDILHVWRRYIKVTIPGTHYFRVNEDTIPTSNLTAQTLVTDGFTVSQKDHAGVTTTWSRAYTATGSTVIQTDGRGNAVTEKKDIAGRTLQVTDAAGNVTTLTYDFATGQVAVLTDALGKTTCYKYDICGRKTAEYGTAIQPSCFAYDEASNLIRLTTFRSDGQTITTDPSSRTDGDVTEWEYAWQEKLVLKKTYADGSAVTTQYGDMNRVASVTDARGRVITYTYDAATKLLKSQLFSDEGTPDIFYTYNHLGQPVEVEDGSGTREITYDAVGHRNSENVTMQGTVYSLKEYFDLYDRSAGYELVAGMGLSVFHAVQDYGTDGRLSTVKLPLAAGMQTFGYSYLPGTHLPGTLTMPGGVSRELVYEEHRDLPTHISYKKGEANIASRAQTHDALGRPITRSQQRGTGAVRNDAFTYNDRSELTAASLGGQDYAYDYDNIGNRKTAQEVSMGITYDANNLNQYTAITEGGGEPFPPEFDADGNQTLNHTETGVWEVTYNAANRPVKFTRGDGTEIECGYDYMGRRWYRKVTENGVVTSHECYLYRGFLQIAALDMLQNAAVRHAVLWDPSEPVATRPLALLEGGSLYMYGFDFNKNVTELLDDQGESVASYDYSPYGAVSASGEKASVNPLQWSSEVRDETLGMVYYNYRYLNPLDGRWICLDPMGENGGINLYSFTENRTNYTDSLGLSSKKEMCCNKEKKTQIEYDPEIQCCDKNGVVKEKKSCTITMFVSCAAQVNTNAIMDKLEECEKKGQNNKVCLATCNSRSTNEKIDSRFLVPDVNRTRNGCYIFPNPNNMPGFNEKRGDKPVDEKVEEELQNIASEVENMCGIKSCCSEVIVNVRPTGGKGGNWGSMAHTGRDYPKTYNCQSYRSSKK